MNEEESKNNQNTEDSNDKAENMKTEKKGKEKFVFNCTKCGNCCENRGPIPITFMDLQNWAKNYLQHFSTFSVLYRIGELKHRGNNFF